MISPSKSKMTAAIMGSVPARLAVSRSAFPRLGRPEDPHPFRQPVVQQLRPGGVVDDLCEGPHTYDRATCRQVRDPEIALTCGECGESSLLLRRA